MIDRQSAIVKPELDQRGALQKGEFLKANC